MRSTFLTGEIVGHLSGLGGQTASGSRLRVIELLRRCAALLFHNGLSLLVLETIVNGLLKNHPTAKQPAVPHLGKGANLSFLKKHSWARGISSISTKSLHVQAAAFNNAFKGANRDRFVAMHGHNHLAAIS